MCRQNHTTSVDYFAVGIMAYECIFGRVSKLAISVTIKLNNLHFHLQRPYVGKSRKEIRDHILSKQIQIKRQDIPKGWSVEAADFVNKVSN